jgi:hypothetical protein
VTYALKNIATLLKFSKDELTSMLFFYLHAEVDTLLVKGAKMDNAKILPHEFIYEGASRCSAADNYFACSAVMPSLPFTIKWLRDCVKKDPSLKVQVRLPSAMTTCSYFNLMLG